MLPDHAGRLALTFLSRSVPSSLNMIINVHFHSTSHLIISKCFISGTPSNAGRQYLHFMGTEREKLNKDRPLPVKKKSSWGDLCIAANHHYFLICAQLSVLSEEAASLLWRQHFQSNVCNRENKTLYSNERKRPETFSGSFYSLMLDLLLVSSVVKIISAVRKKDQNDFFISGYPFAFF